jgi:hypothetical protein
VKRKWPVRISTQWLKCDGAREGKWRGNWRMEWVASTLHTTLEHGVSSITTADMYNPAVSSRLNWYPRRFKWTRPFRRKTKSGFCACTITFQTQSTNLVRLVRSELEVLLLYDSRSQWPVYGRSLAGIACSNPTGGMDVRLLWMLCIVR